MKKTLLLSVVASTMIMAGGDIAPVEPVVEAPVEVAAWNFTGQAVAYMQTKDTNSYATDTLPGVGGDLFGGDSTAGALGLQLGATNADVFAGIGAGVEVSTIQAGNDATGFSNTNFGMQDGDALTQAYLTYGVDSINTSVKVGRQTLPRALSPFAFSEGWQVFKNTFDAALVVNSSIPNTTAVYAFVNQANNSVGDISDFNDVGPDGAHMFTLQNKSIDGVTITGSYYFISDLTKGLVNGGDADAWWLQSDITRFEAVRIQLQTGEINADGLDSVDAFGAKLSGNLSMFDLALAYSSTGDGELAIANLAGAGVKTPLFTQSILNQDAIKRDADTVKASAAMKALGGSFGLHYVYADLGDTAFASTFPQADKRDGNGEYTEVDLTYKTKVFNDSTTLFAGYVYQDDDRLDSDQDFVRFWARYNF